MATKTGTKTKAKAKSAAGQASKAKAREAVVREELKHALQAIEENYVDLARLLSEAYHKEFHEKWGFQDFREYCEAELDIHYRKAMYLVDIWDKVKSLNLSKAKVAKLGWTKMKDLAAVINEDNAKEWMEKAEKMTSRELTEAVKVVRKTDSSNVNLPVVTTMTFKMSEAEANIINEAIEEAKKLTESDNAVVALEMICQDWMQEKGGNPERTALEDVITYVKGAYGVDLVVAEKKATGKKKADNGKAKKVEAKAAAKKAKAKEKEAEEDSGGEGDDDANIDDLLGL